MANTGSLFSGIAVGAALAAGAWYGNEKVDVLALIGPATASAPAPQAPVPAVEVLRAQVHKVTEWDEYTGRFEAVDEVSIRARVSGYLDKVHFQPGEIVQKGDVLFTIDPRPFLADLAEAEADLAEARATAELSQIELERAEQLFADGHISQSVLDTRRQVRAIAVASIASAQAVIENARLNVEFTEIKAPVTGRISDKFVSAGNLILSGTNAQPLTTIVSIDPINFVFDVTEQQYLEYTRLHNEAGFRGAAGDLEVAVTLIDDPDAAHTGKINFVDNRLDRGTGTLRGHAVVPNADGLLVPGMFGRMRLAAQGDADRVTIPDRVISSDRSTKFVWIVNADGAVSRRDVVLHGLHDGLRIVEGINAGEQIVSSGLHMIAPGAVVTVKAPEDSDTEQLALR